MKELEERCIPSALGVFCLVFASITPHECWGDVPPATSTYDRQLSVDIARAAGKLTIDPSLSRAAAEHLRQVSVSSKAANLERLRSTLRRQGESWTRLHPALALGPPSPARRELLLEAARHHGIKDGFTHLGVASSAAGSLALFLRRPVALAPPRLGVGGLTLRGRAPARATLSAWVRGPCPVSAPPCLRAPRPLRPRRSSHGAFALSVVAEGPGRTDVELLVDAGLGPEVVFLATFEVDRDGAVSWSRPIVEPLTPDRPDFDIEAAVARLRALLDRAPVEARRSLARAAEAHAAALCERGWAAHRFPGGSTPESRAREAGFEGGVTEVVAVAPSTVRAWKNLTSSPAHLAGLIDPAADSLGLGVRTRGEDTCVVVLLGQPAQLREANITSARRLQNAW